MTEETETMNMKEKKRPTPEKERNEWGSCGREREALLGKNGVRDKERKLGEREEGSRAGKGKRETEREGLVDPARYQEPPLPVGSYIHPDFIYPPCI